jgi:hypothetical protein
MERKSSFLMIVSPDRCNYFYSIKFYIMKKIILSLSFILTILSLYAQEAPPQVPPIKEPIKVKLPTLPQQPIKNIPLPPKPNTLAFMLTSHSWNLIRWWVTPTAGHSISDASFKFNTDGTTSCNLTTPEAKTVLQSGTYRITDNSVSIILKKDANVTMTCSLIYNGSNQTLTGPYNLEVLPIANPPAGYTAGTVTGDMKLELKP